MTLYELYKNKKDNFYLILSMFCAGILCASIIILAALDLLEKLERYEINPMYQDPIYQQNISCPIASKETVREKEITYKLNFEIEAFSILNSNGNYIYVTKEEYDLLKEGDEIPFILNTETESIRLNEKKFAELIKSLKDRVER